MEGIIETSWHSYPKIYALGHRILAELFDGPVLLEEKVDGSQFSFGVFLKTGHGGDAPICGDAEYELRCRSRGQEINVNAPDKMFAAGVDVAKVLAPQLRPGWTYRGEYLQKPRHNVLAYSRIPEKHIIIFDINDGYESYVDYETKLIEASRLGLECVPCYAVGEGSSLTVETIRGYLESESVLGGTCVEGVVIKNYAKFGPDKKALMGKYVSEKFKEIQPGQWRKDNPTSSDIVDRLIADYKTPARFMKAIQHLREAGKLEDSPRDIGELIGEIQKDLYEECGPEIAKELMRWAMPKIQRGIIKGFPEFYKNYLLEKQFDGKTPTEPTMESAPAANAAGE